MSPIANTSGGASSAPIATLFDSTLAADAASIDSGAGGIGQGSQHLLILIVARSTTVAVSQDVLLRFNNDSGANYDFAFIRWANAALVQGSAFATTSVRLLSTAASIGANGFSSWFVIVNAYTQTAAHKTTVAGGISPDAAATNFRVEVNGGRWRNTAAITQVAISTTPNNLLTGSRLSVYGIG